MSLPNGMVKYDDGSIRKAVTPVSAPKRNLFDFNTVAPAPISKPQTTNEQIMARLLPQGTVTQQIRQATAPVIKKPATPTAIAQAQK